MTAPVSLFEEGDTFKDFKMDIATSAAIFNSRASRSGCIPSKPLVYLRQCRKGSEHMSRENTFEDNVST